MKWCVMTKGLGLSAIMLLSAVGGWSKPLPFLPGERLFYAVRWEQVPVARLRLEVQPFNEVQGQPAYHFVFKVQTKPALDAFYPVAGHIEAFTDLALTHSLRLAKDMQEGRSRRTYQVDFDWERGVADYRSKERRKRRIELPEGTLDLVSILYYVRSLPLETGMAVSRPLNSGKKIHLANARVVRTETIVVDGRSWRAFRIDIDVRQAGGVFEKSKDPALSLWLSANARKIPLKVVGKVRFGSFIVELTSATPEPPGAGPDGAG